MSISILDYFGEKQHTPAQEDDADDLLIRVNALIDEAVESGRFKREIDPDTGSEISGAKGGAGDGGFRLSSSTTGAPNSSHKQAKAVDVFDPHGALDDYCTDEILAAHGLYREAPHSTPGWCHLTIRAPKSEHRTFEP